MVLDHSHVESAENVDEGDDDGGDGVAADEFAGAVHRAVEVGFVGDVLAALAGLGFGEEAGVEVGVDGHLLAGHGVEHEPGGDFADARGALGDHHELDDDDDDENNDADRQRSGGDEIGESLDDLPGRALGLGGVAAGGEDQPRHRRVEHQPIQRRRQQQRGKHREFQRIGHVNRRHQDDHR